MSVMLLRHNVQFGYKWNVNETMFDLRLPMYYARHGLRVCLICTYDMHGSF